MNRSRRQPQEHRPEFFGEVFTSTEGLSPHERLGLFEAKLKRSAPDSFLVPRAGRVVLSAIAGAIFLYSLVGLVFVAGIFTEELMK